jgi:hypothetical protein
MAYGRGQAGPVLQHTRRSTSRAGKGSVAAILAMLVDERECHVRKEKRNKISEPLVFIAAKRHTLAKALRKRDTRTAPVGRLVHVSAGQRPRQHTVL